MSNLYHESEDVIARLRDGRIPPGSIVKIKFPSGNSIGLRVHGWNRKADRLVGCDMSWDNLATEWFDLSRCIVSVLEIHDLGADPVRWGE